MSKLKTLDAAAMTALLSKVDAALLASAKPTKKLVLATMAEQGLCSINSTGVEATLLATATALNVPIPNSFANLMSGKKTPAPAPKAPVPVPTAKPAPAKSGESAASSTLAKFPTMDGISTARVDLNLRSLSVLSVKPSGQAKATFQDGGVLQIGKLDDSSLSSNLNLIEFTVSSN